MRFGFRLPLLRSSAIVRKSCRSFAKKPPSLTLSCVQKSRRWKIIFEFLSGIPCM